MVLVPTCLQPALQRSHHSCRRSRGDLNSVDRIKFRRTCQAAGWRSCRRVRCRIGFSPRSPSIPARAPRIADPLRARDAVLPIELGHIMVGHHSARDGDEVPAREGGMSTGARCHQALYQSGDAHPRVASVLCTIGPDRAASRTPTTIAWAPARSNGVLSLGVTVRC